MAPKILEAAGRIVSVKLPTFQVTVDGQLIDSTKLQYPLLVYKEITYFPMTWNVGQGMGLRTQWTAQEGLIINAYPEIKTELRMEEGGSFKIGNVYQANIVDIPVTVNYQPINNTSEEYPLIKFQDITYFPMTWHFAHDNFHWQTNWSDDTGFSIKTLQRPFFNRVTYDDEHYLYAPEYIGAGMFKIPKDLKGLPSYMNSEEASSIFALSETRFKGSLPIHEQVLEQKDDKLYFKGVELLSLEPYYALNREAAKIPDQNQLVDEKGVIYDSSYVQLDEGSTLVSVKVYYHINIPAPYTPRQNESFLIKNGVVTKLEGFKQPVQGFSKTGNGFWIWSYAPTVIRASNTDSRGEVMWVDLNGHTKAFNSIVGAQNLNVLQVFGDELIVEAYSIVGPKVGAEGFFRIHDDGSFDKIAGLIKTPSESETGYGGPPIAYADTNGFLYLVKVNEVKNLSTGQSNFWWDHDLYRVLIQ